MGAFNGKSGKSWLWQKAIRPRQNRRHINFPGGASSSPTKGVLSHSPLWCLAPGLICLDSPPSVLKSFSQASCHAHHDPWRSTFHHFYNLPPPLLESEFENPFLARGRQQWRGVISLADVIHTAVVELGKGFRVGPINYVKSVIHTTPCTSRVLCGRGCSTILGDLVWTVVKNVVCIKTVEHFFPLICYLRSKNFPLWENELAKERHSRNP